MIEWSDTLKIGVEFVDEEHKTLIDSYQKLYSMMREGKGHAYYKELLDFLEKYVEDHFNHEEKVQLETNYPDAESHKKLHDDFKEKIKEIIEKHGQGEIDNKDLIEINLFLKNWLIQHILEVDMAFGKYYLSLNNE